MIDERILEKLPEPEAKSVLRNYFQIYYMNPVERVQDVTEAFFFVSSARMDGNIFSDFMIRMLCL